jgi:type IV secretion system protein VirD4
VYKQSTTRPVNIFYGHMALGVIFCFFITWIIGQYLAYRLGYQARLGQPMVIIKGYPVYYPLAWIGWYYHYYVYAKDIFHSALIMTEISYFIMFLLMLVLAVIRARRHKISGAYGTARWAETKELNKFGLLSDSGVVMGQSNDARYHDEIDKRNMVKWIMDRKGGHVLIHNGPEHVFCFAPTGSHKDVGLVIPTLLSWTDSALIYDIKEELWKATAGWRRKFSHCLRFAPTLVDNCVCFNPLNEIRKWPKDVKDAQEIADILVDPNMSKENKDHWEKTGHNFLVGAILHILYAEPDKSLTGLANFISNPQRPIADTLRFMMSCNHLGDRPHPVISSCAREMLNKSENELSGVVSTAMSFLGLYRDPIIADNTAYSNFAIDDLMNSDRPVSLYFVIPPSDIERARPLLRLILNQFGRRLTEKMEFENTIKESKVVEVFKGIFFKDENKPRKHRLLMMMNEFASLGRLGFFESELSYLRAYGIKYQMRDHLPIVEPTRYIRSKQFNSG